MTVKIVVSCDSDWHGFPCRGFHATPTEDHADARGYVGARGWTVSATGMDLCPSCTRRLSWTAAL